MQQQQLKCKKRMSFNYTPGEVQPDSGVIAGEKLDKAARIIQFSSPKPITYDEAIRQAMLDDPDTARAYVVWEG